jgi:glutathione-specific gamma-glutamylcyclotransferase
MTISPLNIRDPAPMLQRTLLEWRAGLSNAPGTPGAPQSSSLIPKRTQDNAPSPNAPEGLWVFGYASLIWRPEFIYTDKRPARVHGWHRALHMWSRINRGSPECPGLVFALLSGGSCQGMAFHIAHDQVPAVLDQLWAREMPSGVYDPRWLKCATARGPVRALAFTLSRNSPNFCGKLSNAQYLHIFKHASGRYGTTLDYAQQTYQGLLREGIHDLALKDILAKTK